MFDQMQSLVDFRMIMRTQFDLQLLIRRLLTKEQRLLFKN